MEDSRQYRPPPPYPYQQQQPLQGHHSGDYAPYPQINQQQMDQRWGTPVMGAPANPNSHPDNQQAATGNIGGSGRSGSGAFAEQVQASQTQPGPSVPGQGQASGSSPYVQSAAPTGTNAGGKGGGTMDKVRAQMVEYSSQAQQVMNRVWGHLSTGPSMADTAWGRMTAGTALLTKGGFEGVFKSTFSADNDEKLKKTYACFLSTSTGPVAGTLYISNKKIAFCSDRPLSYVPEGGQMSYSYYKVVVPVDRVAEVSPSVNESKPAEKYIQVVTKDKFEFWFMGFVNYEKGVKNLQAVMGPEQQPGVGSGSFQQPGAGSGSFQQPGAGSGSFQQPYPPNQQSRPPNQQPSNPNTQPYPPNQNTRPDSYVPPNQYGMPSR